MEKPAKFFIETNEDYQSDNIKQDSYGDLIELFKQNGYTIKDEGINHNTKKYYWEFISSSTLQLKGNNSINWAKKPPADRYYEKRFDEYEKSKIIIIKTNLKDNA